MNKYRLLFLVSVALIPIQLGKFFFPNYSYVLGLPIDYRAITVYLSDIATCLFIIFFLFEYKGKISKILKHDYSLSLVAFNIYLWLSTLFFSADKSASCFFNLKFSLFSLFMIFSVEVLRNKKIVEKSLAVLTVSTIWVSALIFAQFVNQGSVGLKIIGERHFDSSTVLIAHSEIFGRQFLRPYAAFPHPNVAAAFLTFSSIILTPYMLAQRSLFKLAPALLMFAAILFTNSKSAFLILSFSFLSLAKNIKKIALFVIILSPALFLIFLQISRYQVASIAERLLLSRAALDIALKNPAFGIGTNNFILELSKLNLFSLSETRLLQPVHNVFLLILAENGILGLVLFAAFLLIVSKYLTSLKKVLVFTAILFYFSVDHFLWTLQQGQLIFWLTTAYLLTEKKRSVQ